MSNSNNPSQSFFEAVKGKFSFGQKNVQNFEDCTDFIETILSS